MDGSYRGLTLVALLCALAVGCGGSTPPPDPFRRAATRALERSRAHYEARRYAEALSGLLDAQTASPSLEIDVMMARTLEQLERQEPACRIWQRLDADPSLGELARLGSSTARRELESIRRSAAGCWNFGRGITHPELGPAGAPVTLLQVGDLQATRANAQLVELQRKLLALYGNKVRFLWLTQPGRDKERTMPAARAAIAAHLQGRFWEVRDQLLASPRRLTETAMLRIGAQLGLDVNRLSQDMQRPGTTRFLLRSARWADALGAAQTPAIFVNGQRVRGSLTVRNLVAHIEPALRVVRREIAGGTSDRHVSAKIARRVNPAYGRFVIEGADPSPGARVSGSADTVDRPARPPRHRPVVRKPWVEKSKPAAGERERPNVVPPVPWETDPGLTPLPPPRPSQSRARPAPQPVPKPARAKPARAKPARAKPAPTKPPPVARTEAVARVREAARAPRKRAERKVRQPRAKTPKRRMVPRRTAVPSETLEPLGIRVRYSHAVQTRPTTDTAELRRSLSQISGVPITLGDQAWKMPIDPADPALGPSTALVTVVAFVDYSCPGCTDIGTRLARTMARTRNIRVVLKMRPARGSRQAYMLAYAAMVAHSMGRFWELHTALRERPLPRNRTELFNLSVDIGLEPRLFDEMMDEAPYLYGKVLQETGKLATKVGGIGRQAVYVNGHRVLSDLTGAAPDVRSERDRRGRPGAAQRPD